MSQRDDRGEATCPSANAKRNLVALTLTCVLFRPGNAVLKQLLPVVVITGERSRHATPPL